MLTPCCFSPFSPFVSVGFAPASVIVVISINIIIIIRLARLAIVLARARRASGRPLGLAPKS